MFKLRKSNERGFTELDWLKSWHTFSFDNYYDPEYQHFASLRVINEDSVAAKSGFGTHPHKDMEILTYVISGALRHKDSLGTGSVIKPGELQRMSAGTGIFHSEYNDSEKEPVHLLQIWVMPNRRGLAPGYEQKSFDIEYGAGLKLVASPSGEAGSLTIHQDVSLYAGKLKPGEKSTYRLGEGRSVWLQVAEGELLLNNHKIAAGDGVALSEINVLAMESVNNAHFLLFDLGAFK